QARSQTPRRTSTGRFAFDARSRWHVETWRRLAELFRPRTLTTKRSLTVAQLHEPRYLRSHLASRLASGEHRVRSFAARPPIHARGGGVRQGSSGNGGSRGGGAARDSRSGRIR